MTFYATHFVVLFSQCSSDVQVVKFVNK